MPTSNSERASHLHERHITVGFVLSAAVLSTASLVILNMHQRNPLMLLVVASLAALAVLAMLIRLIFVKVREASFRRTNDRYVGMIARAKREAEAIESARLLDWEKKRASAQPEH